MSPISIYWSNLLLTYDILLTMDKTADPCQDFYQFACGNYNQRMPIPEDDNAMNAFVLVTRQVDPQLRKLMEIPKADNDPKSVQFVKTQYQACMNVDRLEEIGLTRLKEVLALYGEFPVLVGDKWNDENFDWMQLSSKTFHELGVIPFVGVAVQPDLRNSSRRVLKIDECSLGMGNREYYVDESKSDSLDAYKEYKTDTAILLGADRKIAERDVEDLIAFEIELANITTRVEDRRNYSQMYNITTLGKMITTYPKIPFKQLFDYLTSKGWKYGENQDVNIASNSFLEKLPGVLENVAKRTLANYIMFEVVENFIDYLAPSLKESSRKFRIAFEGIDKDQERWKECVESVNADFASAAESMYVKEYFKPEDKAKIERIVDHLREMMRSTLNENTWMDEATRGRALRKLDAMGVKIGYPSYVFNETRILRDKTDLVVDANEYLLNAFEVSKTGFKTKVRQLAEPVNTSDWTMLATLVNARYTANNNDISFPAAFIQNPFYVASAPMYVNYARIGSIMGHEITHGYDDIGRQFDWNGAMTEWWDPETLKAHQNKSKCFIDQYGSIKDSVTGLNLNGINLQGENIADNGGLRVAFWAYQAWTENQSVPEVGLPRLKDYTSNQLFFLNYAQLWCENINKKALEENIVTEVHAPNKYRVLVPLQNFEEFAKTFSCPKGSAMNPEKQCRIW